MLFGIQSQLDYLDRALISGSRDEPPQARTSQGDEAATNAGR